MQPLTYAERLQLEDEIQRLGQESREPVEDLGSRVFERLGPMRCDDPSSSVASVDTGAMLSSQLKR